MADSKDGESFLRKVVRFVANPATDWSDINSRQEDSRDLDLERSELKAMVERKRRNDFVRKREFDMLRKVRREGLSSEQLAALGGSSKIDEIEQQMVGDGYSNTQRRAPEFYNAPTQPAPLALTAVRPAQPPAPALGLALALATDAPPSGRAAPVAWGRCRTRARGAACSSSRRRPSAARSRRSWP